METTGLPWKRLLFCQTATETFVSWRTENEIYLTGLTTNRPFSPPGKVQKRRAAILGNNLKGEVLVTWSEGENFNKPHDLKWQLYDADGQAIGDVGTLKNAFKRWGNAAVFTDSEGNFTILY